MRVRGDGRGSKDGADAAGCGSSEEHCKNSVQNMITMFMYEP
jgi:hypothetical protein